MVHQHPLFLRLLILTLVASCRPADTADLSMPEVTTAYYQEPHRPQFHFSPDSMWMNDPNGMVYYQGEYHLFYQYYPDSTVWGPMHWGHAISKDLVHWEHLPIALYPDSLGYIFSGSAVVDWQNTSGFGSEGSPPMVAIFTYHDIRGERAGEVDFQTQGIAYSLDQGRSWTKYPLNPVMENPGIKDFRDPKVFWYEPAQNWIMILAVADQVNLYGSPDLKQWQLLSEFGKQQGSHGGVWECPDLFPLIDPSTGQEKWVMLVSLGDGGPNGGSGTQYFIGDFDGKVFTNSSPPDEVLWLDYGRDNYAGVSWSDIPEQDGRRIFIGWMSNWRYAQQVPTKKWRSAMTLPRTLQLKPTDKGLRVISEPVREIMTIYKSTQSFLPATLESSQTLPQTEPQDLAPAVLEFEMVIDDSTEVFFEFSNDLDQLVEVGYSSSEETFYVNRTKSGENDFSQEFGGKHLAPRLQDSDTLSITIFYDLSSIELFADGGEIVMTELIFPSEPFNKFRLVNRNGRTEIIKGKLTTLEEIWGL